MQESSATTAAVRSGGLMLTCVRVPRLAHETRRLAHMLQPTSLSIASIMSHGAPTIIGQLGKPDQAMI